MVNGKKVIAICVDNDRNTENLDYISRIYNRNAEKGFLTIVINYSMATLHNTWETRRAEYYNMLNFDYVDAVIVVKNSQFKDEQIKRIADDAEKNNTPCIVIGDKYDNAFSILYQGDDCFERIVRHVVEYHGCRNVYFIAGIEGVEFSEYWVEIYKKVLESNGIAFDKSKVAYGQYWRNPVYKIMDEWLKNPIPPEAIICANDMMAMAVCDKVEEYGLLVPENVIVTGFDGIDMGKNHYPKISTGEVDIETVCDIIAEVLDNSLESGKCPKMLVKQQFSFNATQSCGCESMKHRNVGNKINLLYSIVNYNAGDEEELFKFAGSLSEASDIDEMYKTIERYISGSDYVSLRKRDADFVKPVDEYEETDVVCKYNEVMRDRIRIFPQGIYLPDMNTIDSVDDCLFLYPISYGEKIFGHYVHRGIPNLKVARRNSRRVTMLNVAFNILEGKNKQ